MNQTSTRLGSRDRALVALGAVAVLAVMAALQCPALAVEAATRSGLMSAATLLALLCASILIEDLLVQPLRGIASTRGRRAAPGRVDPAYWAGNPTEAALLRAPHTRAAGYPLGCPRKSGKTFPSYSAIQ